MKKTTILVTILANLLVLSFFPFVALLCGINIIMFIELKAFNTMRSIDICISFIISLIVVISYILLWVKIGIKDEKDEKDEKEKEEK